MKKWLTLVPAFALMTALMIGCGAGDDKKDEGKDEKKSAANSVKTNEVAFTKVCGTCGQKAEEGCCEHGEDCANCEFKAGSVLCCTGVSPVEGAFCMACGEVATSEKCCAEDAETCESCKLHKGAPLCCKLKSDTEKEEKAN